MYAVLEILCALYHELWHWLMVMVFYFFGVCERPHLNINHCPRLKLNDDGGTTTYSTHMSITYIAYNSMRKWMHKLVIVAPAFGFFFLIVISPIYMIPLYISYQGMLWLSTSDIEKL